MAKADFDFEALVDLNITNYRKEFFKEAEFKKKGAGLLLTKFSIKSRKNQGILIPFKKTIDATLAFDNWDKKKYPTCKVTIVKLNVDSKSKVVTVDHFRGPKTPAKFYDITHGLFTEMGLEYKVEVVGFDNPSDKKEEPKGNETSNTPETNTDDKTGNETSDTSQKTVDPAKKANRAKKLAEMKAGVEKMDGMKDKLPKDKLEGNIQKYQTALDTLIKDAKADGIIDEDEQREIDEVTAELDKLKKFTDELQSGQKLTPERRKKINENMDKINARLEAITKKLGL